MIHLKGGEHIWPVADRLTDRPVPFVLAIGGHIEPPPERHAEALAVGTGSDGLYRYDDGDENNQRLSDAAQLAAAEKVNISLGTCGG